MKLLLMLMLALGAGCGSAVEEPAGPLPEPWDWKLPEGVPKPVVPNDNQMSPSKVQLGRRLFYDTRLSANETFSCASCHKQELAFTDGRGQAIGSTKEVHPRGSMSLVNVAYATTLNWGNPLLVRLEAHALGPLFGTQPVELGMEGKEDLLFERLRKDAVYPGLFAKAFPDNEDPISLETLTQSLAAFQRTLISVNSPYDRHVRGDTNALSAQAKRGLALFFSERLECFHCHGGFNFADAVQTEHSTFSEKPFHNTGLYALDASGLYPEGGQGVFEVTMRPQDMGRFKAPTLRNIEVTAPYMHDGSIETLEDVVAHYARGGRLIKEGEYAGDGSENPLKSKFVTGFVISAKEQEELVAFLRSLTDQTFLTNPAHSDPFESKESQ